MNTRPKPSNTRSTPKILRSRITRQNSRLSLRRTPLFRSRMRSPRTRESRTPLSDPPATLSDIPDFWTRINVQNSSNYTSEQSQTKISSYSVGVFSPSEAVTHSSQSPDAARQTANPLLKSPLSVLMHVDITRGWLRGELFYDGELKDKGEPVRSCLTYSFDRR